MFFLKMMPNTFLKSFSKVDLKIVCKPLSGCPFKLMNFVLAHRDALKSQQVYYSTLPFFLFRLDFPNTFTLAPLSVSLSVFLFSVTTGCI